MVALRLVVIGITPVGVIEIESRLCSFFLGRIVRHVDARQIVFLCVASYCVGVAGDTRGAGLWACWSHSVFPGVYCGLAGRYCGLAGSPIERDAGGLGRPVTSLSL